MASEDALLLPQWQEPTAEMLARERGARRRRLAAIVGGVIGLAETLVDGGTRGYVALHRQWEPVLVVALVVSGVLVFGSAAMELSAYLRRRLAARRRWYDRGAGEGNTTV
jgi:hypothetical protein